MKILNLTLVNPRQSLSGSLSHGRPAYGHGCSIFHGGCSSRGRRSLEDFLKDAKIQETYSKVSWTGSVVVYGREFYCSLLHLMMW